MKAIVTDRFEIKGASALEYGAQGLVVVLSGESGQNPPQIGDDVLIARPDGWMIVRPVAEVRDHNGPVSCFFNDLKQGDVVIGSVVKWGAEMSVELPRVKGEPAHIA